MDNGNQNGQKENQNSYIPDNSQTPQSQPDNQNKSQNSQNVSNDVKENKNKIEGKHLHMLDEFIQSCLNKFKFIEPIQSFYDATGKDKDLIISHKSTIPDLVIWNKPFNKNECFEGANLNDNNTFPRFRFYLRLDKDKNAKGNKNNKDYKDKKYKKNKKNKKIKSKNNENNNNEINDNNNEEDALIKQMNFMNINNNFNDNNDMSKKNNYNNNRNIGGENNNNYIDSIYNNNNNMPKTQKIKIIIFYNL